MLPNATSVARPRSAPAPAPQPKPTLLYRIPPHDAGTGEIESLYSLLQRLAHAHSMPPSKLVRMTLAGDPRTKAALTPTEKGEQIYRQIHGEGWGWGWGWDKDAGKLMIGTGDGAKAWARALEIATGMSRLSYCTLAPLTYHVTTTDLVTAEQRVCLQCIREDETRGRLPFERLLWRLGAVSCCPTHKVRLFTPACGKPADKKCDPYDRVMHPGVCTGCGSVGYRCLNAVPELAQDGEVWRAQQCARLLQATQSNWNRDPSAMKRLVRARATVQGIGVLGMAKRVGASQSIFWDWMQKPHGRISLAQLIDIAGVEGMSLSGLLAGKFEPLAPPVDCRKPNRVKRVIPRVNHAELKEAMKQAVSKGQCAKDVVETMKLDRKTLKRHSELYKQLRANTQQRQQADLHARHAAALQKAVSAATELITQGKEITLRNACEVTNERWFPSELRAKCLRVLVHAYRLDDTPKGVQIGEDLLIEAVQAGRRLRDVQSDVFKWESMPLFSAMHT